MTDAEECSAVIPSVLQVDPDPDALQSLIHMGFDQESAAKALQQCGNNQAKAIDTLVTWGRPATATATNAVGVKNDSSQSAGAASLLAQALQSGTSGQQLPCHGSETPPGHAFGTSASSATSELIS